MNNQIILISGATGVGKSAYSLKIASLLGIPTTISTDSVREIIRSILHPKLNPALQKSTYLAGQTKNYGKKERNVQKAEIIRAYKTQCDAVEIGVEGLVRRAIDENISLVLEGVHLMPGKLRETELFGGYKGEVFEFLLYIDDKKVHRSRFKQRQVESPERRMDKYLHNLREIRWIHDYLLERAKRAGNVYLVNNSGSIEDGMKEIKRVLAGN